MAETKRKNSKRRSKKKSVFSGIQLPVLCGVLGVFFIVVSVIAIFVSMRLSAKNARELYETTLDNVSIEITEDVRKIAEHNHHVSNKLAYAMENMVEDSRLEVLKVKDTEIITDGTDEVGNVTSWLQVEGEGVYTVDLKAAEYLYDSSRRKVTVIVPYPEITYCKLLSGQSLLVRYKCSRKDHHPDGHSAALILR